MIARGAASVILAGALILGTSGCNFFVAPSTQIPYDASDGVGATVGDIMVRNVLALSADGETASLLVTIVNTGNRGQTVNLQYESDGQKRTITEFVNGGAAQSFGNVDEDQLVLSGLDAVVGGVLPIFVQYGQETGKTILVPVLDGSLTEYADLLPVQTETK